MKKINYFIVIIMLLAPFTACNEDLVTGNLLMFRTSLKPLTKKQKGNALLSISLYYNILYFTISQSSLTITEQHSAMIMDSAFGLANIFSSKSSASISNTSHTEQTNSMNSPHSRLSSVSLSTSAFIDRQSAPFDSQLSYRKRSVNNRQAIMLMVVSATWASKLLD